MYENENNYKASQYAAAQTAVANQTTGYAGIDTQDRPPIISEEIFRRLADRGANIGGLLMRLETAADRLVGTRPQPMKSDKPGIIAPNSPTITEKLSLIEGALTEIEMRLRDGIERIESFV